MYKKKRKRILQVLKQKLKTYFVGKAFLFLPQLLKLKFMIMEEAEAACICFPTYDYGDYFCFLNLCVVQSSKAFT